MPKLTKKIVDAAELREKPYFIWCSDLPGFGVRVFPSGKRVYYADYRNSGNEADINARVDSLAETVSAIDTRLTAVEEKVGSVKSVADRIEAKLNRPGAATETKAAPEKIEVKAFHAFLRRGIERMEADEVKTLTVANDPSAGYLAPPEFGTELFKNMVEFSPIRQYARVVQITGPEIRYPRRVSGTTAYWVDEIEDRTGSEPAFEQVTLTPWELATFTEVSNQLLEDSAFNLEQELRLDYAESFGKKEGAAFVAGTGVKQPKGVLHVRHRHGRRRQGQRLRGCDGAQ